MKKQIDKQQKARSTWLTIPGALCFGFTLVSLWNQSLFYADKFGVGIAVLFGCTIEAARLNSVDSIFSEKRGLKNPALYIYTIVALICFSANVVAFNAKSSQKNNQSLVEFGKLWQKVAKYKIGEIDKSIMGIKKEMHQNAGLLGINKNNDRIKGYNSDWEKEIKQYSTLRSKISNSNPLKRAEYTQLILLHGSDGHISALNDISYTQGGENVSILIFSIPFDRFWLYLQVIFAGLIELLILYFAYRSKRGSQNLPKKAKVEPTKKEILLIFQRYKKDPDYLEWLNQKISKNGNHKRDKNGWISTSQLPKSKKEKFVEFRDFCNRHPELLEEK